MKVKEESEKVDFAHGCIYICVYSISLIIICLIFLTAICLGFIIGFLFLDIYFNLT